MARRLLIAYGVLGFAFLYLPIGFLVLFSFNDNIIPSLPFRGFTLQWYRELGFDFVLHDALYNSLVIAAHHHRDLDRARHARRLSAGPLHVSRSSGRPTP